MALSRLQNLLRSPRGTIVYVDVNAIDATDSVTNTGTSPLVPFKSIQRALIECSRISYQAGTKNDRFNFTTVVINPGSYPIDNRPGFIPISSFEFIKRSSESTSDLSPWDTNTNFDLTNENNTLYKLNSIFGGVIIPKGCSLVCMDLRKTKFRPLYVPNPENSTIERSAIFRVTGGSYFYGFSILDADPNGFCYKDYTTNKFVPNFSHHKLTVFEYADGVNSVNIDDDFLAYSSEKTDLQMYYEKVGIVYGESSGREIFPDIPESVVDIEPVIDEYRIVGSRGNASDIVDIIAGDGVSSTNIITVTLQEEIPELNIDTAIEIQGISDAGYDGQFVVSEVVSPTIIRYRTQNAPVNPNPGITGATLSLVVDTVNSASPYIYNCSLRSVYGMCGLHADGSKAEGFKSMVVAQYTGIGLQKDDSAFVLYDSVSGTYKDSTSTIDLYKNTRSRFKPEYENYHIKASNDAFIQLVSVFAIGYAQHFLAESGGDLSITNSNSNFGAKSLVAVGFRDSAFLRDDVGYITHIIPPKEIDNETVIIDYDFIDVNKTIGIASTNRLYLYQKTNLAEPPDTAINGYRIGANAEDTLNYEYNNTTYSASIVMPNTEFNVNRQISQKIAVVAKSLVGFNVISSNTITLTANHSFIEGESVRVISDTGRVPDGIENNTVYYVITSGLSANQIRLAKTLSDALNGIEIPINNRGGILTIVSKVSDKSAGDVGHPIQWDGNQWYVNASGITTENSIYTSIVSLGATSLGDATPRTYFTRKPDNRNLNETIYRARYVIPKTSDARQPLDGYIVQSSSKLGSDTEIQNSFNIGTVSITLPTDLKNHNFIASATYSSGFITYVTEVDHNLSLGSIVDVYNVTSDLYPTASFGVGYNGKFTVLTIASTKSFTVSASSDPGIFNNNTSVRDTTLPYFIRKNFNTTYQIYRSEEVQAYTKDTQDGIYYLTLINCSNSPTVQPFINQKFPQPLKNLYPQLNRDNATSDPDPSVTFVSNSSIGEVNVTDPEKSITKETLVRTLVDSNIGLGITNIVSNLAGTEHTIYTKIDHNLSGISYVGINNPGSSYLPGTYYNVNAVGLGVSAVGKNATFIVTVNGSGSISSVRVMSPGSAYGIGNTVSLTGIGTVGHGGSLLVLNTVDNLNTAIDVIGVTTSQYNTVYRVTDIEVGKEKEIKVKSGSAISNPIITGVGITATQTALAIPTTKALLVNSISYNKEVGIATIVCADNHGLLLNQPIIVDGADDPIFNKKFIVDTAASLDTLTVNVGISTVTPATTGSIYVYKPAFTSAGGELNINVEERLLPIYAGITTFITSPYLKTADASVTNVNIKNAATIGLTLGDYFIIDNEIFRVRSTVTSDSVAVYRSQLGTKKEDHVVNSVVRTIKITPVELRRNSIIRASSHTNEYVGFGPGNYSTALPERQDRKLSAQEQLLALATKLDGGAIVYTTMADDGSLYSNTRKTNGVTGEEESINTPLRNITGQENVISDNSIGYKLVSTDEVNIRKSILVEGDNNELSTFNGPVIFNEKVTATDSINALKVTLKGDAKTSRHYSVGIATPVISGSVGDYLFNANPQKGGNSGWVYTDDSTWARTAPISISLDRNIYTFDGVGIGTTSLNNSLFRVGSGTSLFSIETTGVGVGTTAGTYRLNVNGPTNIVGDLNVTGIITGNFSTDTFWKLDAVGIHTTSPIGVNTSSAISGTAFFVNGKTRIDGNLNVNQIIETASISSGILTTGVTNIDVASNNVHYFTSNAAGNWTFNFRGDSTTTLNDFLAVGESVTIAILTTQGSTPYYNSIVTIDSTPVTPRYYGGDTITSGNANSIDVYTYVILKTAASTFTVLYSQSQYT